MISLKNSLILACISFVFSSCKNELKLNAPYKEFPSIYAVLNPDEKIQVIRINKVFLGEGDASQMAKVADSINYKQDEITVTLKHSSRPNLITFRDSMVITGDGAFNNNQRVYVTSEKLQSSGTYTLTVKNTHTGNEFTAVANPIAHMDPAGGGVPFGPPYHPYPAGTSPQAYIDYSTPSSASTKTNTIYFPVVPNAKIYKLVIRNHFYNDLGGGISSYTYDFVDYVVDNPREIRKIFGDDFINIRFTSQDFYAVLGSVLSRKSLPPVQGRRMHVMEYIVYASTQEFVDYNEFVRPSLSLNQNKPLYSNFKDKAALGIFTFRSTLSIQKTPASNFVDSYSSHPSTCAYKFYTSDLKKNEVIGCK